MEKKTTRSYYSVSIICGCACHVTVRERTEDGLHHTRPVTVKYENSRCISTYHIQAGHEPSKLYIHMIYR